jgi:hypothetical protein
LLELILSENDDEMINWILSQPDLEQPDIFRELKELVEEIAAEQGDDVNEVVEGFESFGEHINKFEDSILEEKLATEQLEMAEEQQQKLMDDMDERINGVRRYVIECIVTDAPNAKEMRELARQMIQLEKDAGTYDPENWKGVL